jgi:hypothetical protein
VASHGSQAPPAETVHTTEKHRWLTVDRGWVKAGELTVGEQVQRLDGSTATVMKLEVVPGEEDRYDLTVSNIHTFAVGEGQVVVHNTNCFFAPEEAQRRAEQILDDSFSASRDPEWLWKKVSIAYAQVTDGKQVQKIVALNEGSQPGWRKWVEPWLAKDELWLLPTGGGRHAEKMIVDYVQSQGLKVLGFGSSRKPCGPKSANCAGLIKGLLSSTLPARVLSRAVRDWLHI